MSNPNTLTPFQDGELEVGGLLIVSTPTQVDIEGQVSFKYPLSQADQKRLKALQDFVKNMLVASVATEEKETSITPTSKTLSNKATVKKSGKKKKVDSDAKEATLSTKPNPFA